MRTFLLIVLLSTALLFNLSEANDRASGIIAINETNKTPLFDGICGKDEWQGATNNKWGQSTISTIYNN